ETPAAASAAETPSAPKAAEASAAPAPAAAPAAKKAEPAKAEAAAPAVAPAAANPRMERARKRIWTDLRDGIDLKSLARMDAEAARAEILSAVQEIGQFRGLDVT
ncbi:MAG TPA: protein kinase, partial [Rhodospirillaceae bacterium]|nr:protein kinase [Rhodospirillaceae bacterium]